ncbi:MAG: hypothetical protein A2017_06590 [Lentisphaerae bacterium GWF2_44_16]|nr:MAG: hypothetical protein A2017_06590 [Lentisphaerae bacterium GWF2_44_16]
MKASISYFGGVKQDVEKHLNGRMLHSSLNVNVSDMAIRKRRGYEVIERFDAAAAYLLFPLSLCFLSLPGNASPAIGGADCYLLITDTLPDETAKHFEVRL